MRIALGPLDLAGVGSSLATGLRARGHDARVVAFRPSPFDYPVDVTMPGRWRRAIFAARAPSNFDVLHAIGGRTWFSYLDIAWARAWGRPALIQYNGSECRISSLAARLHPARARIADPGRDRENRIHRWVGSKAATAAIVQDRELASYLVGSYRVIYVMPFAIAIDRLPLHSTDAAAATAGDGPVRVLHAPSDRRIKGSDAIERAMAEAARDVPLEPVTVSSASHAEVLDAIASADVVVDQLNAETPGVLAAEAMALGKPVLCEYDASRLGAFARPCPVLAITRQTLRERLVELCADPQLRARLGREGRDYAAEVHAPERVAAAAERVYEHARSAPAGIYEADPDGVRRLSAADVAAGD